MTSDDDEGDELEILKVAFGESVRKLEAIHRAAESLRSRAGLVLGAATAVGAFAGGLALDRGPSGLEWLLVVAGLAAYAGALGLSLQTILPQEGAWEAGQNTAELARAAKGESARRVYGRLAIRYQEGFDRGEQRLRCMNTKIRGAVALMALELVFFLCLLGLTAATKPAPAPATSSTTSTTVAKGTTSTTSPAMTTQAPATTAP